VLPEERLGGPIHLEVLLHRRQVAAAPREVRAPGDVQLVMGEVRDPVLDDDLEVPQHVRDRLVWPPVDQIHVAPQAQHLRALEHGEYVPHALLPSAQLEQLSVELLDAHADSRHPRVSHGVQLRSREELGHPFDGDLRIRPEARANAPNHPQEVPILGRRIEIRGATTEVDCGDLALGEPRAVKLAFSLEV
jgi:hypothetical protein